MKKLLIITALIVLILAGCSTPPNKISAEYVSPSKYAALSCQQIAAETSVVETRASTMYARLQKDRNKDNTAMAIGLVLFWPALFFVDGDSPDAQTYARLKGTVEALYEASVQKGC